MSRLTDKDALKVLNELSQKVPITSEQLLIYDKLGQYENNEEELGIEASILFKALKEGIFFKCYEGDEIHYSNDTESIGSMYELKYMVCCNFQNLIIIEEEHKLDGDWWETKYGIENLKYSDYGKTWALTREELK